jgi:hypothetical protein
MLTKIGLGFNYGAQQSRIETVPLGIKRDRQTNFLS